MNGIYNLRGKISDNDIVVISFVMSPLTPQKDIDDSIKVCREHSNAIASVDIYIFALVLRMMNTVQLKILLGRP